MCWFNIHFFDVFTTHSEKDDAKDDANSYTSNLQKDDGGRQRKNMITVFYVYTIIAVKISSSFFVSTKKDDNVNTL